jgi:hypothetical protein
VATASALAASAFAGLEAGTLEVALEVTLDMDLVSGEPTESAPRRGGGV